MFVKDPGTEVRRNENRNLTASIIWRVFPDPVVLLQWTGISISPQRIGNFLATNTWLFPDKACDTSFFF